MHKRLTGFSPRGLERRAPKLRAPRKVTAVAYDGERTEADYFRGWSRKLGTVGFILAPFFVRSGGNAFKAVQACKKKIKSDGPFDEVWCVCDIDDTNITDLVKAKTFARRENINLCLSSRCFEVWLALHWSRIPLAPLQTEEDAVALVSQYHRAYNIGSKEVPFEVLFQRTEAACLHADWLTEQGHSNPTTDVHLLVKKLFTNTKNR